MVFSLVLPGIADAKPSSKLHESLFNSKEISKEKVSKRLMDEFKNDKPVTFLVKFKEKANTADVAKKAKLSAEKASLSAQKSELMQRSAVVSELKTVSLETQQNVLDYLKTEKKAGTVKDFTSYYIVNGMAVTATKEVAQKLATFAEVEKILPNEKRELFITKTKDPVAPKSKVASIEWNVERVNAPQVWDMGIDGSGTVVASIDTGVQWDHPALKEKYRGYNAATGQVDHAFNWFDATIGQATPYDDLGHGTHVTGTMVGSEPNGANQVGVAPGAKFISVKAFTNEGGNDVDLIAAAQWILAPTDANGNTRVDLAPDVVNNSWGGGPGLDEWYRDVVINWRAAEIFPEFSAGNTTFFNPGGPGSVAAPANYPEAFATGATDINNKVANFSLRGPSPYAEIKPDISAPGVNIRSSVPGGAYEGGWNGTSMSGPAVSGVAALLRQVNANLTVDDMEQILLDTATPLTDSEYPTSPNHGYGYGLVDAYTAVTSIANGLGKVQGQVTKQGDDSEAPTFTHSGPSTAYAGMDLDLLIQVSDNISVSTVNLQYKTGNGEWKTVEALRKSGDYKAGEYIAMIPGAQITGNELTYKWVINDFGNNEVTSEDYVVQVQQGITVGYFENFETSPAGWTSFGNKNSWEWGTPTSGPGQAASGEKVYATNLAGKYESSMNATLVMPPIDLPAGPSYLQFKDWHEFEQSSSGRSWDYGHVFISTDQQEWIQLRKFEGKSTAWSSVEIDLSAYSGQRVYIGFNAFSDSSVVKEGWYIDDVALSNVSQQTAKEKALAITSTKSALETSKLDLGKQKKEKKQDTIEEKRKAALEKPIDPTKIRPVLPKKELTPIDANRPNPTLLPLGAQVSILETGRSVYTSPADGKYTITHTAGAFTAKAEAYGYQSENQAVTIEADGIASANFTLQEVPKSTVTGTITDQSTGEAIEGATVILVEDANVAPVQTDANGNYSLTAYEGTYTVKIVARGFHGQQHTVVFEGTGATQNFELEPFYTYPGGEIGYDDGTAENARAFYAAGNGWGVKMSLPEGKESAIVTEGLFRFWNTEFPDPGGTDMLVEVWDAKGVKGTPGKKIAGPITAQAKRNDEWTVVDLTEHNIVVNGDFYMVYIQSKDHPNAPALGTDEDSSNTKRNYQFVEGTWSASPAEEGNYMIRARVDYEVYAPTITSPKTGHITNVAETTIEGKATPTTTVLLKKDGQEAGSLTVGNDGLFAIPTTLTEGANEFKVESLLNGKVTGESDPVTVTLDTVKPKLAITNPKDGDKTNRESVTVEGTVSDDNLDWVKVNGQVAQVVNGTYSKRILLENGQNVIKVVARDKANNKTTKTVTVSAQYNAPVIDNLTPATDLHLKTGKTAKIEFDSTAKLDASFVIHMPLTDVEKSIANATELPMREVSPGHYVGYWTVPSGITAKGAQIEVKVVDDHSNETRQVAAGKLFINVK